MQFPDELLQLSSGFYSLLKNEFPTVEFFVLADTSYGSCCVDEVAAEHVKSELVIHFGHACLSQTSRLPVIYAFGEPEFDINVCFDFFSALLLQKDNAGDAILLLSDVRYMCRQGTYFDSLDVDTIYHMLKSAHPTMCFHYGEVESIFTPNSLANDNYPQSVLLNRRIIPDVNLTCGDFYFSNILFIGEETSSFLITLVMTTKGRTQIYSYSPKSKRGREEGFRVNLALSKRFLLIFKF